MMYRPDPHPEYTPRRFEVEGKGGRGAVIVYERRDRQGYDIEVWGQDDELIDAFRDQDYFHGLGRGVDALYRPSGGSPSFQQPGIPTARDRYAQDTALRLAEIEAEVREAMERGRNRPNDG